MFPSFLDGIVSTHVAELSQTKPDKLARVMEGLARGDIIAGEMEGGSRVPASGDTTPTHHSTLNLK